MTLFSITSYIEFVWLREYHKKIAIQFSENEGGGGREVEGRLEFFRKFIRFGTLTRPLMSFFQGVSGLQNLA